MIFIDFVSFTSHGRHFRLWRKWKNCYDRKDGSTLVCQWKVLHDKVILNSDYLGDQCFLNPVFPMPIDLGAGILLTDQKDVVVNCFGFNETNVTSSCFIWRRDQGVWKPPKEVSMENHIKLQLESILNNSIQHFLFPTHTFCKVC